MIRILPAVAAGCGAALIDIALGWIGWRGADRDEIGLLLPWAPAILALLALLLARSGRRARAAGYAATLVATAAGQAVLLGAAGLAAVAQATLVSVLLALLIEVVVRAGMAIRGRRVAAIGLAILLATPGAGGLYLRAAAGDGVAASGRRVAVLAGAPLRWREGADLTRAGPDDAWRMLDAAFMLQPIDDLAATRADRWLLVQPRAPGAAALVAIDARIRNGARAVILTDPDLRWPSRYPPGHPAGPPRTGTLAPLLLHWGLTLVRDGGGIARRDVMLAGRRWRLVLAGAGRFVARGAGACRTIAGGLLADCVVGRGRVLLLADADLLDPAYWGDGRGGWSPAWRRSDDAAFVAALVAALDGIAPPARPVAWRRPGA